MCLRCILDGEEGEKIWFTSLEHHKIGKKGGARRREKRRWRRRRVKLLFKLVRLFSVWLKAQF